MACKLLLPYGTTSKKMEGDMNTINQSENEKVTTSLYSIIESIEEELRTGESEMIPTIIAHMIESGKIKLTCETDNCRYLLN
ncbi:MAG: hypothetical protein C4522_12050 [Desulfobacteraceae bacterium]|nr:MAG: hypothetical protein C4522_12050 [Desulfobacteraceae bacterium]